MRNEYGFSIVGGLFAATIVLLMYIAAKEEKKHWRRVFGQREVMPFEEWFARYYPEAAVSRAVAEDVLNRLAKVMRIQATQIRLDDRFTEEFAAPGNWRQFILDDPVDLVVEELFKKYAVTDKKLAKNCWTVRDLIGIVNGSQQIKVI